MTRLTLFITLCSFGLTVSAQQYSDRSFTDKLNVYADKGDETVKALFSITKNVHQFLNLKFYKLAGSASYITLKIEGKPPSIDTYKIIYFKRHELEKMNSAEILYKITKSLVTRSLASYDSKQPPPEWLIASLVYMYTVGDSILTQEKYPITRLSIINNKFPKFDAIIKSKAPLPKHLGLYSLYGERCSVFYRGITSLRNGKKSMMRHLVHREAQDILEHFSDDYEEFKTVKKRDNWYKNASQKVCFNVVNPYPPEEIRKKVTSLLSVTIARPGNNGFGTMKVPLEEITKNTIDRNYLTLIERELIQIGLTSSVTIRPAIQKYLQCIFALRKNELDEFKEMLKSANKEFQKAINRQTHLNRYLDDLEKKYNGILTNFRRIISTAELSEKRNKEDFKEFNNYLDDLEKKLAEIKIE